MNTLVTGATGFVGNACIRALTKRDHMVFAVTRQEADAELLIRNHDLAEKLKCIVEPDLSSPKLWQSFKSIDTVIHTAARVHQMAEQDSDSITEYHRINTSLTLQLARNAAQAQAKRFIFISTIKVNGEFSQSGQAFRASDNISPPSDPYALSKYEAEIGLRKITAETGMELVIIRPPLVYGPGVKANFLSMMRVVKKGWPLPLGAIHNKRSLLALDNLVDLILACAEYASPLNRTFLASDQQDVSTTELLRMVGKAVGQPAWLIPVPENLLTLGLCLLGKKSMAQRLFANLAVDSSETTRVIGWKPRLSLEQGLNLTAAPLRRK
jgi:nucleoside-diphosphate-sugar epimerase